MTKQRKDTGIVKVSVFQKLKNECEKHNINLTDEQYLQFSIDLEKRGKVSRSNVNLFCSSFLIPYATYNDINDVNYVLERYYKCNALGFSVTEEKLKLKYGDIEGIIRWESRKSKFGITKEKMIIKHGLVEGTKKWDSYCQKQAETNSLEYKSKKYGMTEDEFKEYNSSRAVTKENLIKRHGLELGTEKWNEYVERQSYAGCKLEYFIEKYGEIDGKIKWDSYIENKRKSLIAQSLFNILYEKISELDQKNCYYYDLNDEIKITVNKISKKFDFCIINKKFIIEFNGDVYHANPIYNKADDIVKYAPKSLITASEIWKRDEQKIKFAEDAGYKVLVVWESEYKENKEKVINDLLEVISNEPIK